MKIEMIVEKVVKNSIADEIGIKKGDKVYIQAGAGIVADSDPESEYNECCNKVRALAKVLVREENL